ncbi:hypothetical protein NL676_028017 [Syzygium grande]|nr:hypothetical protein NL676_028017 [Syzygium grande]
MTRRRFRPSDLPRGAQAARWPGPGPYIIECRIGELPPPPPSTIIGAWAGALGFVHVSSAPLALGGHASASRRGRNCADDPDAVGWLARDDGEGWGVGNLLTSNWKGRCIPMKAVKIKEGKR